MRVVEITAEIAQAPCAICGEALGDKRSCWQRAAVDPHDPKRFASTDYVHLGCQIPPQS